ncbi:DUF4279 domain-containing protein [Hahella ganghwensis]|uniref:DUF4279 domain-containing protein n=1 Tax=Hahella ganghwensis TaxID=286420 RepID=UPI00036DA111|nr:DUF4279 domain-containing protein [Hahella ganghwensis]
MSTNEARVYFALDGDIDPEEVTNVLEITPSEIRRKGDRMGGRLPKHDSWILSTDKIADDYVDIYELSKEIVDQLKGKKDLVNLARNRFSLTTRLVVVLRIATNDEIPTPAMGFDPEVVRFLGEVGAFIDIDTYRNSP